MRKVIKAVVIAGCVVFFLAVGSCLYVFAGPQDRCLDHGGSWKAPECEWINDKGELVSKKLGLFEWPKD